jgi:hypothetical protein
MAMTRKRAERLIGYEVREMPVRGDLVAFGAFDGVTLVAQATGLVEWIALETVVQKVYEIHSRRVLAECGWRCARCRRMRRLQIHHRRYRSHGGTHRVENLEAVCWDCHRVIHQRERSA